MSPIIDGERPRESTLLRQELNRERNYNTGQELENTVTVLGIRKKNNPIDKTIFLGCLAGFWVFCSGMFSVSLAGGIDPELRALYPILPRLATAISFPSGIVFIVLFGGELFTGNTMIMTVSWLNKRVSFVQMLSNWLFAFIGNTLIILLLNYLFAYQTSIFEAPMYKSYIIAMAEKKANYSFHVIFLLAIPANALVCLAFFLGLAARDVTGKILGLCIPVAVFAATGWEHCIANVFYISLGSMYGANVSIEKFVLNIVASSLGNVIGGAFLIGGSEYYLYHWHHGKEPEKKNDCTQGLKCIKVVSIEENGDFRDENKDIIKD